MQAFETFQHPSGCVHALTIDARDAYHTDVYEQGARVALARNDEDRVPIPVIYTRVEEAGYAWVRES